MSKTASPIVATRDLQIFDEFSHTTSLYTGEPYKDKGDLPKPEGRYQGRQFTTSPPKKGNLNEATFGQFLSLATSEPYDNRGNRTRSASPQKGTITQPPFKVTPPTKGPYHTFSTPEYVPEPLEDKTLLKKKQKQPEPRGIYVNQPKRGRYDVFSQPEYVPDPLKAPTFKASKTTQPPFRGMAKTGGVFDNTCYADVPVRSRAKTSTGSRRGDKSRTDKKAQTGPIVPFRPCSPSKKSYQGTFNPFPAYIPELTVNDKKKKERPKTSQAVFRPAGTTRVTVPCPSICAMNANH
ncbi:putative protein of unknown function (DUF4586) [Blattamonas nauphoetae]|uniref:Cilia-and flagella-associated protein 96 n=1 Tax=Blattamonas nauphoetae TaxID=2049346 RepID=A0ABQ9YF32_9EUKA|nr:putative protein of unknown function (DUF4586) [Blattamonas nauphoetae]